jgi:NitT/TauT family transport system substrate-binding protein
MKAFLVRGFVALCAVFGLAAGSAHAADKVSVGIANTLNDVTLYIAQSRGFFRDENLDVEILVLDSGAKMIAPLGTGQLDVGGGALSAGFYNAVDRNVGIKIVADRGRTAPGFDYQMVVIRKDLVDSGAYKGLADLKGKKMAAAAPGVTSLSVLNEAMKSVGLTYNDVEKVFLPFPQQVAALRNGAIDGSLMTEPYATQASKAGFAVRTMSTETFYPGDQVGTIFYSEKLIKERPDVAKRFMKAYLRAVRAYVDAVPRGKIEGPGADDLIQIITKDFGIDAEVVRAMSPQAVDPNGMVNMDSIRKDWTFFREQGQITGTAPIETIVDTSFAEAAAKELGPYKPKTQ